MMEERQEVGTVEEASVDELEQEFADGDERFEEAEGLFEKEDLPDPEDMSEGSFTEVPEYVTEIVNELREKHYCHLNKAKIYVVFREARWKAKGRTVHAQTKVISPAIRLRLGYDFQMIINREEFEAASDHKKRAIIDQELCRCDYKENQTTGEITWKINTPDLEGYVSNVKRYGFWTDELKNAKGAFQQPDLFEDKDE